MSNENEADLLRRLLAGERRAFRRFYGATQPRLLRWVLRRVDNVKDGEELVQDTYLALVDSLPLFRGNSSLWTFLVSIARHEVADYWRKRYAKKAILFVPFMDQVYTERLYDAVGVGEAIERVLASLTVEERRLLDWKYDEELGVGEIAKKLGISVKAAESRLFRARRAFQVAYGAIQP